MLRLFCRSLFQISALLLFQLAGGERGRASKYICDTISPPNITVTPLKAISRELECREPNGLISGLVAMLQFWQSEILFVWLSSWHQGGLFYGLLSNQTIKLFKCKEEKKEKQVSQPRRRGRTLNIFLPHKVAPQNVLPANQNKKKGARAIWKIHHLCSELEIFFFRGGKKKNQLALNLFMDFCDQCKST